MFRISHFTITFSPYRITDMKRFLPSIQLLALAVLVASAVQVQAQDGTAASSNGPTTNTFYGTQHPFVQLYSEEIQGDYVAAGTGLWTSSTGSINLSVPPGASIEKAFLFWGVLWSGTIPSSNCTFNNTNISGVSLGSSGSPCRGGSGLIFFYADVTGVAVSGNNTIGNVPNGVTTYPLTEGATLVLVYKHPAWDYNTVTVVGGPSTFVFEVVTRGLGTYTAYSAGNPGDQVVQHTYIVADGQNAGADGTAFNSTATSGPGTGILDPDTFTASDGPIWDTRTFDVSSIFSVGTPTPANATISSAALAGLGDCLTWGAHVISVKTALNAFIDVRPGTCPNPFNVSSKGVLPVAILGSAGFDVANIDPSTVTLNGVPRTAGVGISDVGTPYGSFASGCNDCSTAGPDLTNDLTLHFSSAALAATLGSVATNDCVPVVITGQFYDGTPFSGTDIIRIINNSPKDSPVGIAGFELQLDQNSPNPVVGGTSFSYTLPAEGFMQLAVYNALGQKIATVAQGVQPAGSHMVSWNGLSDNGARMAPGVYLYRLETGSQSISKKLLISK
jgi:hypothetical protein